MIYLEDLEKASILQALEMLDEVEKLYQKSQNYALAGRIVEKFVFAVSEYI